MQSKAYRASRIDGFKESIGFFKRGLYLLEIGDFNKREHNAI